MKPNADKKVSITIAIPTRYGGETIMPTLESIRALKGVVVERLLVIADRTPIPENTAARLRERGVELVWNSEEGSLARKMKQMFEMCETNILVVTHDDVIFKPNTVMEIMRAFEEEENNNITMVATKIAPIAPKSFVESVIGQGIRIPGRIASLWNSGDNYLAASGRCLSFRTKFAKKFRVPEGLINLDAYLYLENKRLGGVMRFAGNSVAYIRAPGTVKEQVRPSSRFLISQQEIASYFRYDLSEEYRIPLLAGMRAVWGEMIKRPIITVCYLFVLVYTRLKRQSVKVALNPFWKVDASTKSTVVKD